MRHPSVQVASTAPIASLLVLGAATAAHAGGTYATIKIQNNFSSTAANAPRYFGSAVSDAQIWLYLNKDPSSLSYNSGTAFTGGQWVQLSTIQNGIISAEAGVQSGAIYAVISQNQPANPPQPTPSCSNGCTTTDLAYGAFEWDFHVAGYENADIQNIDQFSFTNRFTVSDSTGAPIAGTGFGGSASTQAILQQIESTYGGGGCNYPGTNFPANFPLSPASCSLPTGCDVPPYSCSGLPADYLTAPATTYNRMTQKIGVVTGIPAIDSAGAYRWVGSSKTVNSALPGTYVNVLQGFGKSFEPYLAALYNSPQNASGYYVDYSGSWTGAANSGYSFTFQVTQGVSGNGHGIQISNIRIGTLQSGGPSGTVNRSAGTPFAGTVTILANGEPILNTALNGCATVNPYNQYSGCSGGAGCCSPATGANPAVNSYGLWTDAVLQTGAAVFGCNGQFGGGPVITATGFDPTNAANQALLTTIIGQISSVLIYGIITPTWNPQAGAQGTNYIFGAATQQTVNGLIFQAGAGNADAWTQALWQYQDLSEIQGSSPAAYRSPLYVSTYGDRFGLMKPGPSIPSGATILWELGVPMTGASCPADLNHDGQVNGNDLSVLIAGWTGTSPCTDCVADLNQDGKVNASDLTVMLAAWGPCPG